jgi:hypothetical protein
MRFLSIILRTTAQAPLIGVTLVAPFGLGFENNKSLNFLFFVAAAGFAGLAAVTLSTKTERKRNAQYLAA